MLMVIFGAGASYDSVPAYPPGVGIPTGDALNSHHRPPLANELFVNRPVFADAIRLLPECQPIVPRLRGLKGESLETALQDLQSKARDYPRGLQQLAAVRYYLQLVMWQCGNDWMQVSQGVTNYKTLLDYIERSNGKNEPVCLVTFNYDMLIEDALRDFGLQIKTFEDYTSQHKFYRVFKVHGSVNWARVVETEVITPNPKDHWSVVHEFIRRVAELRITNKFLLSPGIPTAVVGTLPVFPAIAIPVEKGKSFECPPALIEELTELLPHVTKLLIVGWRASEEHFLGLLRNQLRRGVPMHVVAGSPEDAKDTKVRMYRALLNNSPADISSSDAGFTDFIVSGIAGEFLGT
jgi:hypothetical protein